MNKEKMKEVIKEVVTLVLVICLATCCVRCWNNHRVEVDTPTEYDTDENLNI